MREKDRNSFFMFVACQFDLSLTIFGLLDTFICTHSGFVNFINTLRASIFQILSLLHSRYVIAQFHWSIYVSTFACTCKLLKNSSDSRENKYGFARKITDSPRKLWHLPIYIYHIYIIVHPVYLHKRLCVLYILYRVARNLSLFLSLPQVARKWVAKEKKGKKWHQNLTFPAIVQPVFVKHLSISYLRRQQI